MKKYFLLALVFILTISNISTAFAGYDKLTPIVLKADEEAPEISAESAILINADSGDIIYQKQSNKKQYPASITKLMTVLLALENADPSDIMTFSRNAVFSIERNSNHIAIDVDERLSVMDGLHAIMLVSANEVSNGIAEHISGSMEEFAKLMTKRAEELGCKNTSFKNANGLHEEDHYTTAYDMALIAKELLKYDLFKELATTTYYEIEPTNIQSEKRYLHMQNKMVMPSSNYYYEYCIGGKTGFTDQALNTLVTYAQKDGMTLICVVLKENGAANTYKDSITLFDYGFNNYTSVPLFTASGYETTVKTEAINPDTNEPISVSLKANSDFIATVPKDTNISSIQKKFSCPEVISSATAGEAIGEISFMYNDLKLGSVDLVAQASVRSGNGLVSERSISFVKIMIIAVIFAVIGFGVFLAYVFIRREIMYQRRKRRRRQRMQALRNQNR
ncbi:MAG: D-alanyl-D-alanine carboxypeptidase [Lachnospiraceae bacterium]|nr:D-alanyl-D-alanine carboxypeptidase [Lachnospiraceae bacterium]